MTGATRPSRSYMTSLIWADTMPCSARNQAGDCAASTETDDVMDERPNKLSR
jgi:hypothetical protein